MSTRRAHHFIVEKIFVSNIVSMTKNFKFWTRVVVKASWAVFLTMDRQFYNSSGPNFWAFFFDKNFKVERKDMFFEAIWDC